MRLKAIVRLLIYLNFTNAQNSLSKYFENVEVKDQLEAFGVKGIYLK